MKQSELKEFIKNNIIETLSEASPEDVKAQQDLNAELEDIMFDVADVESQLDELEESLTRLQSNNSDLDAVKVTEEYIIFLIMNFVFKPYFKI